MKGSYISFRVDPGFKKRVEEAAKRRGMNVSQFMSMLLVKFFAQEDKG